jgi:DNA polymerase-3 subunit epsilon
MQDKVVVCHSAFNRVALQQAAEANGLETASCRWLDTTRVVRRTWPRYLRSGYGLANLTREFGIPFKPNDAVEDARATGMILLRAMQESGLTLDDWLVRATQPVDGGTQSRITRTGDPEGPLAGEIIVFTGALSMPRRDAADAAAAAGCKVEAGVTKNTTLLVVGDQDVSHLAPGRTKSSKHLKAEALIAKGQPIRILRESDFRQMAMS